MRIAVHLPTVPSGSRLERAVRGLGERGHLLLRAGKAAPGSALAALGEPGGSGLVRREADVVVGGACARGPLALAALAHARALVLGLEAQAHRRWGVIERWGWSVLGGFGVIPEEQAPAFLAQVSEGERERLSLWPAVSEGGEAVTHPDTTLLERTCERALARRMAGPARTALFVDRDGTIIEERNHLSQPDGVALLPGVAAALRTARAQGHPVVVVSNQAGVGRGLFPERRVHEVMARLRALLRAEGVELDAVRHCPHAPDAGCDCRKPGTRLLREAAEDLRLWLPGSVMVGDKWIDVAAGHAASAAGVLVLSGHGAAESTLAAPDGVPADLVCPDLAAAVRWFLARSG